MRGAEANGDARHAGDRLDDAHELRRSERAAIVVKARREIGDANRPAIAVDKLGHHDRRVAHVFRAGDDLIVDAGNDFFDDLSGRKRGQTCQSSKNEEMFFHTIQWAATLPGLTGKDGIGPIKIFYS